MKVPMGKLVSLPKFKVGDRVMVKPKDEAEANAGWEMPEGRVLAVGRWTLVLLDEEFRGDNRPIEFREERLELIK